MVDSLPPRRAFAPDAAALAGGAALKDFDWSTASFRWLVGIGSAAVGYIGLGAVGL